MTEDFTPPIKDRDTEELLEIVGSETKWNPKAIQQALTELKIRKVDNKKIEQAKYISKKTDRIVATGKAKEGYDLMDFISEPFWTIIEILFSWELRKDGFHRKAKQQKTIRTILAILILCIITYVNLK